MSSEDLVARLRQAAHKMIADDGPDTEWEPQELIYWSAADEIESLTLKLDSTEKLLKEMCGHFKRRDARTTELESRLGTARDLLHEAVGRLGPDLGGRVLGFLMGAVERRGDNSAFEMPFCAVCDNWHREGEPHV